MLSKILILSLVLTCSYAQFINKHWPEHLLLTPSGKKLYISWAVSNQEKMKGLSDLPPTNMAKNQGLLFYYEQSSQKVFWMPNTHFDLDIIFLNKKFEIVAIESNVKHFPSKSPESKIPRTRPHFARYVLELHANQAKEHGLKKGSILKWQNKSKVMKFIQSKKNVLL